MHCYFMLTGVFITEEGKRRDPARGLGIIGRHPFLDTNDMSMFSAHNQRLITPRKIDVNQCISALSLVPVLELSLLVCMHSTTSSGKIKPELKLPAGHLRKKEGNEVFSEKFTSGM